VTAVPNSTIGETFSTSRGDEWRILAIDTEIDEELIEQGINDVFTVEPVTPGGRNEYSSSRLQNSIGARHRRDPPVTVREGARCGADPQLTEAGL
jgi:hypothetical protein